MDIYASDEEKAEEIKQWWRDNGRSVIAGIVIGVIAVFGGRYWLNFQQVQAEQASVIYQQSVAYISQNDSEAAQAATQELMQNYASTAYAVFAALQMAEVSVNQGELSTAEDFLYWVKDNAELGSHRELARLRLARLKFSQDDNEQALELTAASETSAFNSLFAELEGDIKFAMGDTDAARAAYQKAALSLAAGEPRQRLLQMKMDDVAAHES
ncbi:YfgM family protein [Methylophaga sp.]|uniref:YfgM family protein n=1 Tax=Methylophaga sp. TaxID=2024840 RepID=UPI003F6A318E